MKKVYLLEVKQNNERSYIGSVSARELVRLATTQELNEPQEAQRPIEAKRLDEISEYVMNDGTIATAIVIGTCDSNRLSVHKVENSDLYYMDFPETEEEFEKYKNSFFIMDGQHRLFSFLEDRIKIDSSIDYDLMFNMYITPTLRTRRLIFKNTNEKQKSVASNLLLWFRKQLNMLSDKEKNYHTVVELLNSEAGSPLKSKIIIGAERVSGGFKAEQIINILSKSKIKFLGGQDLSDEKMYRLICEYISGWEEAVGVKIIEKDRNAAPFSKISGFRFMVLMLPTFFDKAMSEKQTINKRYIDECIRKFASVEGITAYDIFNTNGEYIRNLGTNPFSAETPTTIYAEEWSNRLKNQTSDNFDPLAY